MIEEKAAKTALSEEYDRIKPAVMRALIKGERIECALLKNGLKVTRVRREELKNDV